MNTSMEYQMTTKTIKLDQGDPHQKRQDILDYFQKTYQLYESIFECLADESAFYHRANPLRHPLIFYYGHTAVFYINKLRVSGFIEDRVDHRLESMLAIGVDEMSWDDLNEAHYDWPASAEVKQYRDKVRVIVEQFIQNCEISLPIQWDSPLWIIMMGIEHERIHLETTSVLIRELPVSKVTSHHYWGQLCTERGAFEQVVVNDLQPVSVQQDRYTLGKLKSDPLYGWDNEYGQLSTKIKPFSASQFLVSNRAFFDFVQAGGYSNAGFWSEEGWQWVQFKRAQHPVYWVKGSDQEDANTRFQYRAMLAVIEMPWSWPAEVNYHEAEAYCAWYSATFSVAVRLPTEAEWYQLRAQIAEDQPDWQTAPGNINLEYENSPCPVDRFKSSGGFYDVIGNVWQWTQSMMDAFPGFEVHPAYDDFSTPTFDQQHAIFKGGSWVSTGNLATKAARYAFRKHFFQHAGFRFVAGEIPESPIRNTYETSETVAQYIEFQYGDQYFEVPNFAVTCARLCIDLFNTHPKSNAPQRALDLGCATGRSAFELATYFKSVEAIDFSANLIKVPIQLQEKGIQRYVIQQEGALVKYKEIALKHYEGYEAIKDRVTFLQGDACNLSDKFSEYDLVFAGNLLDRLYDPALFLKQIKSRIRDYGFLVLTSPYTWLEEFTPKDKWLGGFKAATGENYTTLDGLSDNLMPEFELMHAPTDVPFVIRETARKFQHTLAQLSVWQKHPDLN